MSGPLQDQLGDVMAELERHRRALSDTRSELSARRTTVRSKDRMVSVTVGPGGEISGMQFHTTAYAQMPPAQLAAVLTETINRAREQMAGVVRTAMEPFRDTGRALRESMIGGSALDDALKPAYELRDEMRGDNE